ncbi:MAG: MmcQ/YjbR family DNA-binding protein [Pirellulales bacterium]
MLSLRKIALRCPGTTEGVACAGTSLERSTFKTRNKAFLFLGITDAMVKLRDSLDEASRLAAKEPDRYRVGGHGWVKVVFSSDASGVPTVLEKWVGESYRLMAGSQATATRSPGRRSLTKKKTVKKKAATKTTVKKSASKGTKRTVKKRR